MWRVCCYGRQRGPPLQSIRGRAAYVAAELLQDLRHGDADVRVKLIGETGDEQCDVVRHGWLKDVCQAV